MPKAVDGQTVLLKIVPEPGFSVGSIFYTLNHGYVKIASNKEAILCTVRKSGIKIEIDKPQLLIYVRIVIRSGETFH